MKALKSLLTILILINSVAFCHVQEKSHKGEVLSKKDSLPGKLVPGSLKKVIDVADSFKKRSDSLQNLIDVLSHQKRSTNKDVFDYASLGVVNNNALILAIAILVFGVVVILSILIFLYKLKRGFGNYIFQSIGLIIVATSALFLIVTGYDKDQITPVIGLFGTIVGFIFGSNLNTKKSEPNNDASNKAEINPKAK